MVHPVFDRALERKPRFRVFGLPLLPLTLGHVFLLREHRSPFVTGDTTDDPVGDLLRAVFVCAQHHEAARRELCKHWRLSVFLAYWGWRCRKLNPLTEALKFNAYLQYYRARPATDASGGNSIPGAPEEWWTLAMLTAHFHFTREQAMDCGTAEATALWAADGERRGVLTIADTPGRLSAFDIAWNHQHRLDLEKLKSNADARN